MDVRQMREIPIADFLSAMGIHPTKQKGNALWYSAPYRTERTPSFKVDTAKNVWFDFGTGTGGDIFDLAEISSYGRLSLQRAERVRYLLWSNHKEAKRKNLSLRIFGSVPYSIEDCWVIWKNEESMPTLPYPTARRSDTVCMANDTMPSAFVTMQEDWNCATAFSRVAYHRKTFH